MGLCKESEVLLRLLRGERIYKTPFWEVWFAMESFFQRRYGDYKKVENRIKMAKDLGMAAVLLGSVDINASFAKNQVASNGSSHYAGGSLVSLEQLEERKLPDWSETARYWKKDQKLINDKGLISWVILPWCFHTIVTSMGLRNFAVKLHEDFEFIDTAFEWVEERSRKAIDSLVREVEPDFVLFDGDCSYKHGLMVNPQLFRRLVYDRMKETISHVKQIGIPYTFHSDGKLDDVIPLLVELGFSAVHGCEKKANDLEHLVKKFGDDIVLVGNMDVVFLAQATPKEVRDETKDMLRIGGKKGRFVASCNTSPLDYIPEQNYLAMVETIRSSFSIS
ncbi:MAG: uroporphyrinogen decarboxylase family protein [Thermoproteota archaeon]